MISIYLTSPTSYIQARTVKVSFIRYVNFICRMFNTMPLPKCAYCNTLNIESNTNIHFNKMHLINLSAKRRLLCSWPDILEDAMKTCETNSYDEKKSLLSICISFIQANTVSATPWSIFNIRSLLCINLHDCQYLFRNFIINYIFRVFGFSACRMRSNKSRGICVWNRLITVQPSPNKQEKRHTAVVLPTSHSVTKISERDKDDE